LFPLQPFPTNFFLKFIIVWLNPPGVPLGHRCFHILDRRRSSKLSPKIPGARPPSQHVKRSPASFSLPSRPFNSPLRLARTFLPPYSRDPTTKPFHLINGKIYLHHGGITENYLLDVQHKRGIFLPLPRTLRLFSQGVKTSYRVFCPGDSYTHPPSSLIRALFR